MNTQQQDTAEIQAHITHAARHGGHLTPQDFGPQVTLDGMDAAQWIEAVHCPAGCLERVLTA